MDERHSEALAVLRREISALEARVGGSKPVSTPPPLPKKGIPEKRHRVVAQQPGNAPVAAKVAADIVPETADEPAFTPPTLSEGRSFELDFGKVWFVRIGVVILLTGLVFLGNYAYQNWIREMPNGVRLAALYLCAGALIETGRRLAAKANLHRFGEVLLAGGMAFFYYCTFAAHHVGRLQVIDSPIFGAVLLFGAAGAIAAVSWIRQAKATAALGFVLAAYATMLQPIGWMSCVSNVLLGAMGLLFMLKPGWSGPGWASMLGSYGAFFGWQLLGASSGEIRTDDPATLWFLLPLWVMFSVPAVVGKFRESLTDRARAWFTGANNALFFVLFSAIWIQQNGDADYWKVAAIFGPILLVLGTIGRRQEATAGGVNISQGLAIATFALVLKLEGQNLALVLAFESLALAIAAWKFRGKSETVFSLLAGLGSAVVLAGHILLEQSFIIPVWSIALAASLIAAASVVAVRIETNSEKFRPFVRFSAGILFTTAALIASYLCLSRLGETTALLTAASLAGVLSLTSLKLDLKRRQPEIIWAALWFLGIAAWLSYDIPELWPLAVAAAISLAACWHWHTLPQEDDGMPSLDLAKLPMVPAWAFSAAIPFFLWKVSEHFPANQIFCINQFAALLLVPIAVALRCPRLALSAGLYSLLSLVYLLFPPAENAGFIFGAALLAAVSAGILYIPWAKRLTDEARTFAATMFRASAFISYCSAWHSYAPDTWTDWLALTSIALTLISVLLKRKMFEECLGLIGIALGGLAFAMLTSPWRLDSGATSWRGITVVIAMVALVLTYRQRPALIENTEKRKQAVIILAGLTCLVTAIWATQMLVWRFGWKPTAVLWTLLGFSYVSAGLWQRLHILRLSGFVLLLISFAKLFLVDVWDFTTFMRVASFIVLGAALILLGLFYNKFAHVIKNLLDDEK